jgi:hypothetical protein
MKIDRKKENDQVIIEHDGLMVSERTLEEAIISYGEGMYERGNSRKRTETND